MENKKLETELTEVIKVAVKWWGDKLRNPLSVKQNNGEKYQEQMLGLLRLMSAIQTNFKEEDICKFEKVLAEKVLERINLSKSVILSIDYSPNEMLSDALKESIKDYNPMSVFPCKTVMWVELDEVNVREGYGAETKILYSNENNTELLTDMYNYIIFGKHAAGIAIVIDFKYYLCELDIDALHLDPDADSIKITKRGDKYFAEKLEPKKDDPKIKKEIIVKNLLKED